MSNDPLELLIDPADGDEWPDSLPLDHELTVDAWIESTEARLEVLQSVASQWRINESFNRFNAFDAGATASLETKGYFGAIYDGRHVYFSPEVQPGGEHAKVLRFDTHGDFRDPDSYEAFDAGQTDGLDTRGYYGGACDGRFVYFTPRLADRCDHTRVLRYDTRESFMDPASWSAFDVGEEQSNQGAAFDGAHVYFCPGFRGSDGRHSGRVIRYRVNENFKDPTSYQVFNAESIGGLNVGCYDGGAFDGRHVYFCPLEGSIGLRYDSFADFMEPVSWEAFDANAIGMGSNVGAVFDGQYLYYVPYQHGVMVRFDTAGKFDDPGRWEGFDAGATDGLDTRGFDGGFFDGRFIYYVPFVNERFHGNWLRFDPLLPFDEPTAWKAYDASNIDGLKSYGFNGGAFDGRFFYAAPWRSEWGEEGDLSTWDIHGRVLRYDTTGPDATFSLRACDYGHNGGLGAGIRGPSFLINSEGGCRSAAATHPLAPGKHHLAGVYDGAEIRVYVDGEWMKKTCHEGMN